jgi:hypothetical protein
MGARTNKATEAVANERLADFEQLVWALLDEQITEEEFKRLEKLIESDERARTTYLECVQLHVDLADYYSSTNDSDTCSSSGNQKTSSQKPPKSPVLGFLNQTSSMLPVVPPLTNN